MQESPVTSVIQAFENNSKPVFVVYGAVPHFERIITDFRMYCQNREDALYLPLDMELAKRDSLAETLFEILQQIGYWVGFIAKITDSEKKFQIDETLQTLHHFKKHLSNSQSLEENQLVEFVRFSDSCFFPALKKFLSQDQKIILEYTRFEQIAKWSKQMWRYIFDPLINKLKETELRCIIFTNSIDEPRLYSGSSKKAASDIITFHKIPIADQATLAPFISQYDVFLCYNQQDKSKVQHIRDQLSEHGLTSWLDEWDLMPVKSLQEALETEAAPSKSVVVCVGASGIGEWQDSEHSAFLRAMIHRHNQVITVYLSNWSDGVYVPLFLQRRPTVDFRRSTRQPLEMLVGYITGNKEGVR